AATGAAVSRFDRPFAHLSRAEFSPDGRRLLAVGGDRPPHPSAPPGSGEEARLFDADTGRELGPPLRVPVAGRRAVLSPDGRPVFLTDGSEGCSTLEIGLPLRRHASPFAGGVAAVRFSPATREAFLVGGNGAVAPIDRSGGLARPSLTPPAGW